MRLIPVLVALTFIFASCSPLDQGRFHSPFFQEGRFHNIDDDEQLSGKNAFTFLHRKLIGPSDPHLRPDLAGQAPEVVPLKPQDLFPRKNENYRLTWLGHSTVFIAFKKGDRVVTMITDPIFGELSVHLRRYMPMPLKKEELPPVDYILISHNHRDHCDEDSLLFLQEKNPAVKVVMPEGMVPWADSVGLKHAVSVQWFKVYHNDIFAIHALPSHHWSRRNANDMMQAHWASYAIVTKNTSIYFAGDTAFSSHFEQIAKVFPEGFDYALMPVGAYSPRWYMKLSHISPPEVVKAARIIKADKILPIHWGTFKLADEHLLEPIVYLRQSMEGSESIAHYWVPGESHNFAETRIAQACAPGNLSGNLSGNCL